MVIYGHCKVTKKLRNRRTEKQKNSCEATFYRSPRWRGTRPRPTFQGVSAIQSLLWIAERRRKERNILAFPYFPRSECNPKLALDCRATQERKEYSRVSLLERRDPSPP